MPHFHLFLWKERYGIICCIAFALFYIYNTYIIFEDAYHNLTGHTAVSLAEFS